MPVLLIGIFNTAVDPYGVSNSPSWREFNLVKPEQDTHNKLFKTIDVIRFKPTTVLFGSSRVILGLDPSHPALMDRQNSYNFGILGLHVYELNSYVQHSLINQPNTKQVIIGVDFFMFNQSGEFSANLDENLGKNKISLTMLMNLVFSWNTFQASQKTIMANFNNRNLTKYYSRGMRIIDSTTSDIKDKNFVSMKDRFKRDLSNYLTNQAYYKDYKLSNRSIKIYKDIIHICQTRNIDIKVFISPEAATQLEAIRLAGLWSFFEQWKREWSQITPLWDFSSYNSITTEPISDNMHYFLDGTHYSKQVGDLILNRVLSYQEKTVPMDFGILITPKNIESHLAKIRGERDLWANQHPDEVNLVQQIKQASE